VKRDVVCEGYSVRLVWEDDQDGSGKPAQRRTLLTGSETAVAVLSPLEVASALDAVDATPFPSTSQAGPFNVFPSFPVSTPTFSGGSSEIAFEADSIGGTPSQWPLFPDFKEENALLQLEIGDERVEAWMNDDIAYLSTKEAEAAMAMMSIKQKVLPEVDSYVSSASSEERSLLHYWITILSGMMLPTQRYDNPFRTIFVPLALNASRSPKYSSGSAALLHAIYAVSAFNRARLSSSPEHLEALGTKHHEVSLGHLRRSLMQFDADPSQREAVLATIITMSSIEVMTGNSTTWRTHHEGGKIWLQSIVEQGCTYSDSFSLLCQIFFCISALGNPVASDPIPESSLEEPIKLHSILSMDIWDSGYRLEQLFGVTKPVLQAIMRINAISDQATEQEKDDLEIHIRRNDPDVLVAYLDDDYEEITRHHACSFFCATLIYFERRVRETHPSRLQRLVQRSLDHLDVTRSLENKAGLDVCGLFWPEFITTCEAEDVTDLRARSLRLLEKGKLMGIGNIISAERVVLEVWGRRDSGAEGDVTWHAVMNDLGLDIILT
jgi:hypothetical protein